MTPEQQKAIKLAAKIQNEDWRLQAVMLIAANRVDDLVALRRVIFNSPWTALSDNHNDWDQLRLITNAMGATE